MTDKSTDGLIQLLSDKIDVLSAQIEQAETENETRLERSEKLTSFFLEVSNAQSEIMAYLLDELITAGTTNRSDAIKELERLKAAYEKNIGAITCFNKVIKRLSGDNWDDEHFSLGPSGNKPH